jgi:hypothetical protein
VSVLLVLPQDSNIGTSLKGISETMEGDDELGSYIAHALKHRHGNRIVMTGGSARDTEQDKVRIEFEKWNSILQGSRTLGISLRWPTSGCQQSGRRVAVSSSFLVPPRSPFLL